MNDKITVLIVDDHKLFAEAWSLILNNDQRFLVLGTTDNADDAYRMVEQMVPSIALVDINMSPVNGLEITKKLNEISATTKIIGVSVHSSAAYARKMMRIGAKGYVTKNSTKEELFDAIIEVDKGNKFICQEIKDLLTKQQLEGNINLPLQFILTKRELEIAYAVVHELSSREIASKLNISMKTVEVHRYNILKKLNLKNTVALINCFKEQGL